jgi:hypothetical protein
MGKKGTSYYPYWLSRALASDMEASEVIDRGNAMSVLVSEWNKA